MAQDVKRGSSVTDVPARKIRASARGYCGRIWQDPRLRKVVVGADKLLASRAGQQKIGELAFERAKSYSQAGRILEAIDELHVAHISSFTRETAQYTVYIPLFLAKLYADVRLFGAAKYCALASTFAALKIGEDSLRPHIYRGLAEAAASDHANGASLGFFLTLKATLFVASQFSTAGSSKIQDFEWGRLNFYTLILTYGASFVSQELSRYLVDELLPTVGLRELYDETLPEIEHFFGPYVEYLDFARKAIDEGIAPPYADAFPIRNVSWLQLGVKWVVEWENDYRTTAMAEEFVALLQILLTDLRTIELSLFPADVEIRVAIHSGALRIEEIPSNERVIRKVFLPKEEMPQELVFGIAATILKVVSAYPEHEFLAVIEKRVQLGLSQKMNPHAPYDVLYREFYSEEDYEALHKLAADSSVKVPPFMIKTPTGLSGSTGLHKNYDPDKSRQAIENRYSNSLGLLKHTLPRLVKDDDFRSTVAALRKEGWKDWHVLLAVGGVRLNFVVDKTLSKTADPDQHKKIFHELLNRHELESDPAPPTEMFTVDKLRFSLELSQISTLKGMGFECWQRTPVTAAVDAFLRRFNYWTDDVPHTDPFLPPE